MSSGIDCSLCTWMEQAYFGDGLEWFPDALLVLGHLQSFPLLKVKVLVDLPGISKKSKFPSEFNQRGYQKL